MLEQRSVSLPSEWRGSSALCKLPCVSSPVLQTPLCVQVTSEIIASPRGALWKKELMMQDFQYVHCSIVYNCQGLEAAQVPISR